MAKKELWVIGNYCHDTLVYPGQEIETLGGSAAYIGNVFAGVGLEFELASKVGKDFKYTNRVARKPIVDSDSFTTHFLDDYRSGERVGSLLKECSAIDARDLPDGQAEIGLLCGVASEILPETLIEVRKRVQILICDIQGLIRATTPSGKVFHRRIEETPFYPLLPQIDFLKVSEHEVREVDVEAVRKQTCLIVTQGRKGATLIDRSSEIQVKGRSVEEIDSTGAGDCFVAGFALAKHEGRNLRDCLEMGNEFGAIAVGSSGLPRAELFKRRPGL
jgi:1D-myo-inositol 3-kinase